MIRIKHRSKIYKKQQYALKIERERRVRAYGENWVKYTETIWGVLVRERMRVNKLSTPL